MPAPSRPGRWRRPRTLALAWALATLAALAALSGAPGVSRDEAALVAPAAARGGGEGDAGPPLARAAAAIGHAAGAAAGLGHARAYRLASALAGAVLSALLAIAAWRLAGPAAAALAPALFWLAPRTLHAGLVATPDGAVAALALAAVLAWRRASSPGARAGAAWAAGAGLLLGAAVLARADAWTLALALAGHAACAGALGRGGRSAADARGAGVRVAIALASSGALVVLAWPGVLRAGAAPWLPPPGGNGAPALALAAIPAPILVVLAGGLAHALHRIQAALRAPGAADDASDDALLVLAAAAALAGSPLAHAPPGARPFLHALPFLALLGARALVRASALAWPARGGATAAALALLVLYPGLRAAVHAFPNGAAAWNELAGGAAGAASRGLRRQDGGEAAAALLREVSARAAPGARIWWPGAGAGAVELYARDGRLRGDLVAADDPGSADLAVVPLDGGSRDAEYRAWAALRTARPASGAYLDEVPLAFVYARPGAWR